MGSANLGRDTFSRSIISWRCALFPIHSALTSIRAIPCTRMEAGDSRGRGWFLHVRVDPNPWWFTLCSTRCWYWVYACAILCEPGESWSRREDVCDSARTASLLGCGTTLQESQYPKYLWNLACGRFDYLHDPLPDGILLIRCCGGLCNFQDRGVLAEQGPRSRSFKQTENCRKSIPYVHRRGSSRARYRSSPIFSSS